MFFRTRESIFVKKIKKTLEALAVGTGIILFWRGIWVLADTFIYPKNLGISGGISLILGILILLLTRTFIRQFLGEIQDRELRAEKNMFEKILHNER